MPASEETGSGPVIHDHRRIDPVTGQVRGKHAASSRPAPLVPAAGRARLVRERLRLVRERLRLVRERLRLGRDRLRLARDRLVRFRLGRDRLRVRGRRLRGSFRGG